MLLALRIETGQPVSFKYVAFVEEKPANVLVLVQTYDSRLFGVIWPSEQAHMVDA